MLTTTTLLLYFNLAGVSSIALSLANSDINTKMKIKLTYFDIEGAAEPTWLALALAGQEYEDDRVKFLPDWTELNPKTPYSQLPLMTIDDGPVRTQS
jgi:hypothetical protein